MKGRLLRLIGGALLLACFFMPWFQVSCGGAIQGTLSGREIAYPFHQRVPPPERALDTASSQSASDEGLSQSLEGPNPYRQPLVSPSKPWALVWLLPAAAACLLLGGLTGAGWFRRIQLPAAILAAFVTAGLGLLARLIGSHPAELKGSSYQLPPMPVGIRWLPAFWTTCAAVMAWLALEIAVRRRER